MLDFVIYDVQEQFGSIYCFGNMKNLRVLFYSSNRGNKIASDMGNYVLVLKYVNFKNLQPFRFLLQEVDSIMRIFRCIIPFSAIDAHLRAPISHVLSWLVISCPNCRFSLGEENMSVNV